MKRLSLKFSLTAILFLVSGKHAHAQQLGFDPGFATYIDSLGADSVLTFTTTFTASLGRGQQPYSVTFGHNPGIIPEPEGISVDLWGETSTTVTITVYLDSVWDTTTHCAVGEPGIWTNVGPPLWFGINLWIYNPHIRGKVHLRADSVDFGQIPLGTIKSQNVGIAIDTPGSIFRKLVTMNVAMPFSWLDSVTPTGTGSCPFAGESSAFFEPTEVGNYIDSVYLYDPLQNDSTLLILLGEGVAAGVSRDVVETNSLRINPNPCDRSAAISLSGEEIEEVTVQNILGERVFESQQEPSALFNLNTSALPSGIYFMEVRSRKGQYREHIIVSH